MLPVLVSVGPLSIYTIVIFVTLAGLSLFYLVWRRGRELHFDETALFDLMWVGLLWLMVGARLGYILTHWPEFSWRVLDWFNVWGKAGWWLPAGMITGGLAVIYQARKRRLDEYSVLDVIVPAMTMAQALLALGAFFNGTGYGFATEWFFGVQFPGLFDKRVPVQLLEAGLFFGLFWWLWWSEGAYRTFAWYKGNKSEARSGFVTACYLMGWGWGLWILSWWRPRSISVWGIAIEPWAYFGFGLLGAWLLYRRWGGTMRRTIDKWQEKKRKKNAKVEALVLGKNIFE